MFLRPLFILIVAVITISIPTTSFAISNTEMAEGFQSLFDGKSLSGWVVMESPSWSVENGEIVCSGNGSGWLRSSKQYQDFILRLEFNISKRGNSGIFIRSTEKGNPAFTGMEVQILDDHGKPPNKTSTGALYSAVAPSENLSKPAGEWNEVEIACIGRRLKVTMNGKRLYAVNLDSKSLNDQLPHDQKLNKRVPSGFIGVQNHGNIVKFRNIRIKDMSLPMK